MAQTPTKAETLKSIPVIQTPNRTVTVNRKRNGHGEFIEVVEERNNKRNWACIELGDANLLVRALNEALT